MKPILLLRQHLSGQEAMLVIDNVQEVQNHLVHHVMSSVTSSGIRVRGTARCSTPAVLSSGAFNSVLRCHKPAQGI